MPNDLYLRVYCIILTDAAVVLCAPNLGSSNSSFVCQHRKTSDCSFLSGREAKMLSLQVKIFLPLTVPSFQRRCDGILSVRNFLQICEERCGQDGCKERSMRILFIIGDRDSASRRWIKIDVTFFLSRRPDRTLSVC